MHLKTNPLYQQTIVLLSRILMSLLTVTVRETLNRLSSFQSLRREGGKFDHRRAAKDPATPLTAIGRRSSKEILWRNKFKLEI